MIACATYRPYNIGEKLIIKQYLDQPCEQPTIVIKEITKEQYLNFCNENGCNRDQDLTAWPYFYLVSTD